MTESDEVLHVDDPNREGNVTAGEYWERLEAAQQQGATPCADPIPDDAERWDTA